MAEAHFVSVGCLIGKEIAPLLEKGYLLNCSKNGGSRFYENGIELNGLGKQAEDFTQCLSLLTGVKTLKKLTLVALHNVLPIRGIFRHTKAWCPMCLEDWKNNAQPIYEPLIWNFKEVKVCDIHNKMLVNQCPHCYKEIPILSRKSRNGYCQFCGCWLGSNSVDIYANMSLEQHTWECYVFKNIGGLLKIGNELIENPSTNTIYNFIKNIIDKAGGTAAFSRHFDVSQTTVVQWFEKIHKPSLNSLLSICFYAGINITDIFESNLECINALPIQNKKYDCTENRFSNSQKRKIDWSEAEAKLIAIIENQSENTPSIREVARCLGYDKRLLYIHFPVLCKKISKNHGRFIEMMKKKRIEEGCQKVHEAIVTLYNTGVYPSRRRIESFLSSNILLREKAYQIVWKETLANLGLQEFQNKWSHLT